MTSASTRGDHASNKRQTMTRSDRIAHGLESRPRDAGRARHRNGESPFAKGDARFLSDIGHFSA